MKGPPPLHVDLGRSRFAAAFIVIACLGTAVLVASLPGPALLRALAVVAIGAHGVWTLRSWALRTTQDAVVRVEIAADGRVALCERSGERCEGRLQPASYVGTCLTTLVVRVDGVRWSRALAILPDMLSTEELRRLRVVLRIAGSVGSPI
jgi:hypothetical protein